MTVEAHRQETAVRYRVYGHILSCNAPLHELEQTPSQDSTENTDLRILFSSADEPIPSPSSRYLTISLTDGTPWLLEVNANPDISPTAGLARMAGVATLSFSDLIRKICDHALAKRGDNYHERWVKTLRLSGLG